MRCIEMCVELQHCGYATEININMRCIEIPSHEGLVEPMDGLTLTWDVLKFVCLEFVGEIISD